MKRKLEISEPIGPDSLRKLKTSLVKDDKKAWYKIELLLERNGVLHSENLVYSLTILHKADSLKSIIFYICVIVDTLFFWKYA